MRLKGMKYGAILVAGILLCTAPLTAWAQKEATEATVEESVAKEETLEESKESADEKEAKEQTEESKEEAKEEATKATEAKETEEEEISDGEVESDDKTDKESEAKKDDESEELATDSDAIEVVISEDSIIGSWESDEEAGLNFKDETTGALVLPDAEYEFTYVLEDDKLALDFVSNRVIDCEYTITLKDDILTIQGGKGTAGGTYKLTRVVK